MELNEELTAINEMFEAEGKAKQQALLDKIKLVKARMHTKDKAIEELKYERDLIFGDLCRIISEELRLSSFNIFMGFNPDMLWKAWRFANYKDEVKRELDAGKLSKDDYKNYKLCFDLTVETVKEKFFGSLKDKAKFKELLMNWTTGYDYVYTYNGQEITVFIPNFSADEHTWERALGGYTINYRESEYCRGWVCGGLDYKKVAKELQDWLKNEGWKKDGK